MKKKKLYTTIEPETTVKSFTRTYKHPCEREYSIFLVFVSKVPSNKDNESGI